MSFSSARLMGAGASIVDRTVAYFIHGRAGRTSHELLSHRERIEALFQIHAEYGAPELFASPDAFFAPPDPIDPRVFDVRELARSGGRVVDASWQSRFEPFLPSMREAYAAHSHNATVHTRLYAHDTPRPAVVLIHGYLGGHFRLEELVWPIRWLYRRGLDVAVVQLPFHGLRGEPSKPMSPPFPGADPRMTNEGFRQAIFDLRALVRWLRARGSREVGAMGMSLGGYTTSLLATVERDLAFAIPMIPLASIADVARDTGRLGTRKQQDEQHRALEAANFIVSPFARPSLVPSDRVLIVAADADKITPPAHAARLSHHFAADIVHIPGSHLVQIGVREAYRRIAAMLRAIDVMEPRESAAPDILPTPVAA